MVDDAPKKRQTNKARKRAARAYQAQYGGTYRHALRVVERRHFLLRAYWATISADMEPVLSIPGSSLKGELAVMQMALELGGDLTQRAGRITRHESSYS